MFPLSVRARLAILWLVVAALLAIGVDFHWPLFVREHRRMEPWQGVLIWASDALALAAFLWFGVSHFLLGRPFPRGDGRRNFDRHHWSIMACFTAGLLVDGAVSWGAYREEEIGLARAEEVWGEIIDARGAEGTGFFLIVCRFQDGNGVPHASEFILATLGTNPVASDRVRRRQFGVPIRISFDPRWPDRNWLTDCGLERGERLDEFSLLTCLVQILCLPFVVFARGVWRTSSGDVPVYKLLPLLVVVALFTVTIVAFWCMGRTGI